MNKRTVKNCWKIGFNYYSKSKYKTYESAVEAEKTNVFCEDCVDCENCSYCLDCKKCYECRECDRCVECKECAYCRGCLKINRTFYSEI